jgi:hypothetical protein
VPGFLEVAAPATPAQNMVNLLASAETAAADGDSWMSGFAWVSESCPAWQGFNPCTELDEPPPEGDRDLVYVVPVAYRTGTECTTLSGTLDQERARRQAERIASFVAARELWTGDLSKQDPYDLPNGGGTDQVNPHLEQVDLANQLDSNADIMAALAELEAAAGEAVAGGPVLIHASTRLIGQVGQNLERVGNELRTKTGAVVVPDAGYPGTGPDGTGDGWMYATGPVLVRLGPIISDISPATTTDRATNRRRVIAERMFAVTFAPCSLFAIQVTG